MSETTQERARARGAQPARSVRRAGRSASSATRCCASARAEVTTFDRGLRKLARRMIRIMHDAPGIGLAAPQVGVAAAPARLRRGRRPASARQPGARRVLGRARGGRRGLPERARRHDAGDAAREPAGAGLRRRRRAARVPRRGLRGARHPARVRPPRGRAHRRPHLAQRPRRRHARAARAARRRPGGRCAAEASDAACASLSRARRRSPSSS